jgi:TRAP transporter 4TM/12TM fusion protein
MNDTNADAPLEALPIPFQGNGANWIRFIAGFTSVAFGLFHLYTSAFGILEGYLQRSIHFGAILFLVFLIKPLGMGKKWTRLGAGYIIFNIIPAILVVAMVLYQTQDTQDLLTRADDASAADIFFGITLTLFTLEACRRAVGLPLTIVTTLFLFYVWAGRSMPDFIAHAGMSISEIAEFQFLGFQGVYNIPIGVMSTFLILFILFGAFLEASGAGTFFIQLASSTMGHRVGGPAKSAVVASGLLGSLTGSVVANVLTTGSFTIPLMRDRGYRPAFAAAVEAAASSGGQIMPPIMGASAFLIAQFLGVSYGTVALAAVLPAILYFLSVGWFVHLEAKRNRLPRISREDLPSVRKVLRNGWHLLIPLLVIIFLLVFGYSAIYAGLAGIIAIFSVSFFSPESRITPSKFIWALGRAAGSAITVSIATANAGIIMGAVTQSGLALRLTSVLVYLSGGIFWITLLLAMASCVILGMGMPTAGAYVIVATLGAPALADMGVDPMSAHMFIFYFAALSSVTPPVALAAYAAAGLAASDPWKTGLIAFQISIAGFIIPFVIVYEPSLLLTGNVFSAFLAFASVALSTFCIAAAIVGFAWRDLNFPARCLFLSAGIFLIGVNSWSMVVGMGIFAFLCIAEWKHLAGFPERT